MLMNSLIKDPALQRKVTPPVMLAITLGFFGAIYPRSHSTAYGALCGAGAVTIAVTIAMLLRGKADNSFVRGATGAADERDQRILLGAGAVLGLVSVLCVAAAMVAVLWGADAMAVLGVIAWVQVITFVVAHVLIARRS